MKRSTLLRVSVLIGALAVLSAIGITARVHAQNAQFANVTAVQPSLGLYYLIPISSTAAVNTQTTLTIPAPNPGLYNYVCRLAFEVSADGTGGALANLVSTSTNFGSFAVKFSNPATVGYDSGTVIVLDGTPATGCSKSAAAATATTFVSPASATHSTFTWYATYFQAP